MIEKKVLVESTSDIDIGFAFIVVCQPFRFIMRPLALRFEETCGGNTDVFPILSKYLSTVLSI
jgi:hypothetical protein